MDSSQQYKQPYSPYNAYAGAPPTYNQYSKPNNDPIEQFPGYIKWPIKIGIVILAIAAIVSGIIVAISFDGTSIIGGVVICLSGFVIFCFEAPILCTTCCRFAEILSRISTKIPPWLKMILYIVPGIAGLILCISISSIIGSLCLMGISFIYCFITFRRATNKRFFRQ